MQHKKKVIKDFYTLAFYSGTAAKMINLVTLYRIFTFPVLLYLLYVNNFELFKWMLGLSFLTDAIDGQLARTFKVNSIFGARLDSIGDDLTVLAGAIGLVYTKSDFLLEQIPLLISVFFVFVWQTVYALIKYKKPSAYHTYLAKIAAVLQGLFLLSVFFFESIWYPLYYSAILMTGVQLLEEIAMTYMLPVWKNDVKGVYWAMKLKKTI